MASRGFPQHAQPPGLQNLPGQQLTRPRGYQAFEPSRSYDTTHYRPSSIPYPGPNPEQVWGWVYEQLYHRILDVKEQSRLRRRGEPFNILDSTPEWVLNSLMFFPDLEGIHHEIEELRQIRLLDPIPSVVQLTQGMAGPSVQRQVQVASGNSFTPSNQLTAPTMALPSGIVQLGFDCSPLHFRNRSQSDRNTVSNRFGNIDQRNVDTPLRSSPPICSPPKPVGQAASPSYPLVEGHQSYSAAVAGGIVNKSQQVPDYPLMLPTPGANGRQPSANAPIAQVDSDGFQLAKNSRRSGNQGQGNGNRETSGPPKQLHSDASAGGRQSNTTKMSKTLEKYSPSTIANFSRWFSLPQGKRPLDPKHLVGKYNCGVNHSGRLDYRAYGGLPQMDLNLCAYVFNLQPGVSCPNGDYCYWRHWAIEMNYESWVDSEWWWRVQAKPGGFQGDLYPPDAIVSGYKGLPRILKDGNVVLGPYRVLQIPPAAPIADITVQHPGPYSNIPGLLDFQKNALNHMVDKTEPNTRSLRPVSTKVMGQATAPASAGNRANGGAAAKTTPAALESVGVTANIGATSRIAPASVSTAANTGAAARPIATAPTVVNSRGLPFAMSGNSPSSAGSGLGVSFFQSLLRKGQQD